MKRHMPIEITLFARAAGEVVQKRPAWEGLAGLTAGVTNIPVMLQGELNAGCA
jgi:hypothetical protein